MRWLQRENTFHSPLKILFFAGYVLGILTGVCTNSGWVCAVGGP